MRTNKRQKAVVGYVRTAMIPQAKEPNTMSAEVQEKKIKGFCKKKGYKLSEIFSDSGRSGANLNRPGLQTLLAEALAGRISKVICFDTSRLSRRAIDFLILRSLLKKHGVSIVTVTNTNTANDYNSSFIEEVFETINSLNTRLGKCRGNRGR